MLTCLEEQREDTNKAIHQKIQDCMEQMTNCFKQFNTTPVIISQPQALTTENISASALESLKANNITGLSSQIINVLKQTIATSVQNTVTSMQSTRNWLPSNSIQPPSKS
jgi:hypothetical protein